MATNRIKFGSDFVLKDGRVGIATTAPREKLEVAGTILGDFEVTDVTTFQSSYAGFTPQKQNIVVEDSVGIATVGVGTFVYSYETETGNVNLDGNFATVSEDIIVEDGKIFEVTEDVVIGTTTSGTQDVYVPNDSEVSVGTLESVSIQNHFSVPDGGITERQQNPIEGSVRFNDDLNTLEFYNGIEWRQFTVTGASGRGVFGGGERPYKTTLEYINITSQGNSSYFGDLTSARFAVGRGSSSTRGLFAGGQRESPAGNTTNIDYITIASGGNGIFFGDLTVAGRCYSGCSSSTRALFGGVNSSSVVNYVEISTLGNAITFGNLLDGSQKGSACSSPTRGIFTGISPSATKMDLLTISSTGNAVSFGDLTISSFTKTSCSSSIRGIFSGGYISGPVTTNTIDYITIATEGNGVNFGDLSVGLGKASSTSNETRGIIAKGSDASTNPTNVIQYITISSFGDSVDFGDVSYTSDSGTALSDSHGGLGGF
jgi:hypothetical protein